MESVSLDPSLAVDEPDGWQADSEVESPIDDAQQMQYGLAIRYHLRFCFIIQCSPHRAHDQTHLF